MGLHPLLVEPELCSADSPDWLTSPVEDLLAAGIQVGSPSKRAVAELLRTTVDSGVAAGPSSLAVAAGALPCASYAEAVFLGEAWGQHPAVQVAPVRRIRLAHRGDMWA